MKMIAKHGVIYHDTLYVTGSTIDVADDDVTEMEQYCSAAEEAATDEEQTSKRKRK